jgi:hypothetical protein
LTLPEAFVLMGGFGVVCRNPLYISELKRRGLVVLLICPESFREAATHGMAREGHIGAQISEVAFVAGSLGDPGSFTAEVIARALAWRRRYRIKGVYAVGEVLVEQAGLLADALELPSPGLRATRACRSKYLQRWYLPEWSPPSLVVPPARRADLERPPLEFPVVVKPASRHSSSGVHSQPSWESLRAGLAAYPADETVLVEQRIVGQEHSVESLVQGGRVVFDSVTRKETTESTASTFVELAHSVPNDQTGVDRALVEASRRVLERLSFEDGVAHSEWRVDPEGRPFLMEIAARTPGDGLLPLYELATGQPMEPEIIRICLGEAASYPRPRRYTRQVYLQHQAGVLEDVVVSWNGARVTWVGEHGVWPHLRPGAAADGPCLRAVLVLRDRGADLPVLRESDDRAVTFLIDAPTPGELDHLERQVRSAIRLEIAPQARVPI